MAQIDGGHLTDLHQAAPLQEPYLMGKAVLFHIGHNGIAINVEAQLTHAVSPQGFLFRLEEEISLNHIIFIIWRRKNT